MAINPGIFYQKALKKFEDATTIPERLAALQEMLRTVPKHKSSEGLVSDIKNKIAKYKKLAEKERQQKKKSSASLSIKKEGAATVCIVGTTNSGKSTLLNQLTNAKVKISPYPFTTTKPEIGTLDYNGVKIQLIEMPAITLNYLETSEGPQNLGIIRTADLLIITGDVNLVRKELNKSEIRKDYLVYTGQEIKGKLWNKLNLIKVYTKEPGKKPRFPPMAMKKGSTIRDIARGVHQDFIKKFKYARVWGSSAKFRGQMHGLDHVLQDGDIVELHIR